MTRLPILALSLLALLLTGVIVDELTARGPAAVSAPPVPPPAAASAAGPAGPSADQVALLLGRPLFSPDRRPPSESPQAPAAIAAVPLPRLTGIMVTEGARQAIFAAEATGKALVVNEGDSIAGFRVKSIADGEVTLQDGASVRSVQPHYAGSVAAGTPAVSTFAAEPSPGGLAILSNAPPPPPIGRLPARLGIGAPR